MFYSFGLKKTQVCDIWAKNKNVLRSTFRSQWRLDYSGAHISWHNCIFSEVLFWAYVRQPDDHRGWTTLIPFASIYSTNPRTNPWNFRKKYWELGELKISVFFELAILIFLLHPHENQLKFIVYNGWDTILMITLITSKFLAMRINTLYSVFP